MIKTRGYNNNSGKLYITSGNNQYKGNLEFPNNKIMTADYENKVMENRRLDRLNNNLPEKDIKGASQLTNKDVKRVENELEVKSNPSIGNSKYRIEIGEQMAQKINADTAKRNMMVNDDFQKIPPLKEISK